MSKDYLDKTTSFSLSIHDIRCFVRTQFLSMNGQFGAKIYIFQGEFINFFEKWNIANSETDNRFF